MKDMEPPEALSEVLDVANLETKLHFGLKAMAEEGKGGRSLPALCRGIFHELTNLGVSPGITKREVNHLVVGLGIYAMELHKAPALRQKRTAPICGVVRATGVTVPGEAQGGYGVNGKNNRIGHVL